jgi:hypothetical protein
MSSRKAKSTAGKRKKLALKTQRLKDLEPKGDGPRGAEYVDNWRVQR